MKITVLQSNFMKALAQISRVVGNRTTLPVLSNALITAEKGTIKISATDLEVGITTSTTGKIDEGGSITLPARLLADFVGNNKDQSIEILTEGNIAQVSSERFEAKIHGIAAEEFPTVPQIQETPFVVIAKDLFVAALKKVVIAPALDETRPVLAGISFHFEGKELTLAATDSYRLAEKKIQLPNTVAAKDVIVPTRTMNEVLRILNNETAKELAIYITENQVAFKIGDTEIVSRLIEGSFPSYSQLIPTSHKIQVKANLAEMATAVKMLSLFSKDSANNNIRLVIQNKEMTITSTATQAGSAKSKIQAEITGDNLEIAFNARYLLDVLNVLNHNTLTLEFNDGASAGVVKSDKDQDFIYIIMPLRLDS